MFRRHLKICRRFRTRNNLNFPDDCVVLLILLLLVFLQVELARRGESGLVKLAVPIIPMLDDYEFSSKESMTRDEGERAEFMQLIWKAIGGSGSG